MRKKKVLVLYTGGTFGMDESLKVPELSAKQLKDRFSQKVPEISRLADCEIEVVFNIDSCQMNASHWLNLANRIRHSRGRYEGAVILHGTDTLAYTAAALSMLLGQAPFPVVITGAQRPLFTLRNDARNNLLSALEIATSAPPRLQNRVLVTFHDNLFLGSRVRKKSAIEFGAFESPRFPVLANIGSEVQYQEVILPSLPAARKLPALKTIDQNILSMAVTPGFPSSFFTKATLESLDAILLTLYTSGTAPTEDSQFVKFLKLARSLHKPVFAITEREEPPRLMSSYEAGARLESLGVYWCHDLTPEAAYVKAMLTNLKSADLKAMWAQPLSDEMLS